jgi:hypothetical protein
LRKERQKIEKGEHLQINGIVRRVEMRERPKGKAWETYGLSELVKIGNSMLGG